VVQHWISLRQRQATWPLFEPVGALDRPALLRRAAPLSLANYADDPVLQLAGAAAGCAAEIGVPAAFRTAADFAEWKRPRQRRLRIGYLSSDLRAHAIGYLMAEMFGLHDRGAFEVFAYYCGIPQEDATKQRIRASVEHWVDIASLDDETALRRLLDDRIDILVDINGHTRGARTALLARRPAPVIVNWLGYPGTMGSAFHHYIIADPIIVPPGQEYLYSEAVLRLPCYQPNDRQRVTADPPGRDALGLPADATVFCSFNGTQKITPFVFDRWLVILHDVPGSVMWLLQGSEAVDVRLRERAAAAGVAPERLIFAPTLGNADHVARYAAADLFLDTSPYGAHTTASDALWMGLPVLTAPGRCFASRVCASLVRAAGLPELIVSPDDYVVRAVALGRDRARLAGYRHRLLTSRETSLLFDTPGLVRALEGLFRRMWVEFLACIPAAALGWPALAAARTHDGGRLMPPDALPPAGLPGARTRPAMAGLPFQDLLAVLPDTGSGLARIAAYRDWIASNPTSPQQFAGWFNLGVELAQSGDLVGAVAAYRQALALQPRLDQAAINLGLALETLGDPDQALAVWEQALQPATMRITLLNQRGRLLEERRDFLAAEQALRASLLLDPAQPDVLQHWAHLRQKSCLWPLYDGQIPGLTTADFALGVGPLGALALTDDIDLQRRSTAAWLARKVPPAPARLSPEAGYRHDRIRVGYVSSDFCRHALSFLMVQVLERHDRRQFEIFGYCSSPEDGSDIRRRVIAALDHHVPIGALDDAAAAQRIRTDEIDILVDLNGLTRGARLAALRWRPAPVQATYLGYIGSVPLPELDYLLCDDFVVPADLADRYAPRPLSIGPLYQANDGRMPELPAVSRMAAGLPEDAFVFCCFSHHYKITPSMFAAWMTILDRVPGSVLWLVEDTPASEALLRSHAAARGVGHDRLRFAPRVEPGHYLARFALADLFLDTFPYNAGTVASDALRMRLPLVTLSGQAFASRMAGSLLRGIGLPAGITDTLDAYVERAVGFATDPALRTEARAILAGDGWQRTLGDSVGFTARLEAAYRSIRRHP